MQESILNQMTQSAERFVVLPWRRTILAWRNDGSCSLCFDLRHDRVTVVAFVLLFSNDIGHGKWKAITVNMKRFSVCPNALVAASTSEVRPEGSICRRSRLSREIALVLLVKLALILAIKFTFFNDPLNESDVESRMDAVLRSQSVPLPVAQPTEKSKERP